MTPRQRGFSLIELIIVVAIMGVLLAVAIPSFQTWVANTLIRRTAESMLNGLQVARMEALRQNQTVTFWLVTDTTVSCALATTGTSWVVSLNQNSPAGRCDTLPINLNDLITAVAPAIIQKSQATTPNSLLILTSNDNSITFNGTGRLVTPPVGLAVATTPTALQIDVSHSRADTRPMRITVSLGGLTRMCDPSTSLSASDPRRC